MFESWIPFAILTAIGVALIPLINEYFKIRGLYLAFWMRAFSCVVLFPVFFLYAPPAEILFYLYVALASLCFAFVDVIYIGLAARLGAGVVSRIEPMSTGFAFILWLIVTPALVFQYMGEPLRAAGIMASFAGAFYFSSRLRRCDISREALQRLLPVVLAIAVGSVFAKLAMDHSPLFEGVLYYITVQAFFLTGVYAVIIRGRFFEVEGGALDESVSHKFFDKKTLLAGAVMGVNWFIHTPSKQYAFSLVENPAYVMLIGLASPLVVIAVYRLIGRKEKADVFSGLGVVACAVLLVVSTQL